MAFGETFALQFLSRAGFYSVIMLALGKSWSLMILQERKVGGTIMPLTPGIG